MLLAGRTLRPSSRGRGPTSGRPRDRIGGNAVTEQWTPPTKVSWEGRDLEGLVPESWHCVDCGVNTAPGILNRADMEQAYRTSESVVVRVGRDSEVYTVRNGVWERAGMEPMGGCLCIG